MRKKVISITAAVAFAIAAVSAPVVAQDMVVSDNASAEACWGQSVAYEASEFDPGFIARIIAEFKGVFGPNGNSDTVHFLQENCPLPQE